LSAALGSADGCSRVLAGPGTLVVDVPRGRRRRHVLATRIRELPSGQDVVLRGGGRAVRWVARAADLHVARDFVALPSAARPAFLIEDDGASLPALAGTLLSVPPGVSVLALPADLLLRAGRVALRARWARSLLPFRVLVGRRR
jgi:hypothetical protein